MSLSKLMENNLQSLITFRRPTIILIVVQKDPNVIAGSQPQRRAIKIELNESRIFNNPGWDSKEEGIRTCQSKFRS